MMSSSKKAIAYILPFISFSYLFFLPDLPIAFSVLPYLALTTKGVDLTVIGGLFLSAIWILYTLTLTLPLYFILGRYFILLIYMPINGVVFFKQPHEPASLLFLRLQSLFWDIPLLLWIRIMNHWGQRALQPFFSEITSSIYLGSIPLDSDVQFLVQRKVGFVVNMCREYEGPVVAYELNGMQQEYIPTPDLCEPAYLAMMHGLHRAWIFLKDKNGVVDGDKRLFIHCKAGRGRSAAFALCLLMVLGMPSNQAIGLLRAKRKVVEAHVGHYRVVERLQEELRMHKGDFAAVYAPYSGLPSS